MKISWTGPAHTVALSAAAAVTALLLTACGSSSGSPGDQRMGSAMGSSVSASSMGSASGGGTESSPSASGMGQAMGTASPAAGAMGEPAVGPHNSADRTFLMQMIPHHAQAVAMADLAATRARSPQVSALAARVKAAQGPEITEMSGWLRGWSVPVPTGDMSGGPAMTGLMSAADMAALAKLSGTAFDQTWLTMMTSHHDGALTMARTELGAGANPDVKTLARSIITSQTAQITEMKTLLTRLPTS